MDKSKGQGYPRYRPGCGFGTPTIEDYDFIKETQSRQGEKIDGRF
jgi:hypothetical protein